MSTSDINNSNDKQQKSGRFVVISLLLFILVLSPFLSWYYLKSGADYRKKSLAELKNYGQFDYFDAVFFPDKQFAADSMKGRISIVSIIEPGSTSGAKLTETMNKLYTQFKDRKDVSLITYLSKCDSSTASQYAFTNNPKKWGNYNFAHISETQRSKLLQGLKLNEKGDFIQTECPYLTYINMDGTVSHFYDVNDQAQLAKLVEHIAMKIKIDPFETPEIKRDKEK
ncbi:MAG: hypothetical protein ACOYOA_02195 [Saprospiraceae bacterium]